MEMKKVSYPRSMATHFVGVGAVVIHDNKVLLVKLKYGRARGLWLIPGGMVDPGETLQEAVIREVKEETGMRIRPEGIIGIRSMVRLEDGLTDVYVVFSGMLLSPPEPLIPQESEIDQVGWISLTRIDQIDVSRYSREIVQHALSGKRMIHDNELAKKVLQRRGIQKFEQYWVS